MKAEVDIQDSKKKQKIMSRLSVLGNIDEDALDNFTKLRLKGSLPF